MKKILSRLRDIFTPSVVTFIAGVITTVLWRYIFGEFIPLSQGLLHLLIIILVILSMAVMLKLQQEITNSIKSKISAVNYHVKKTEGGDAKLYDPLAEFISTAQSSIFVVSRFIPSTLDVTPARTKYYETLNSLLKKKHKRNEQFRYERILQIKDVKAGQIIADQSDPLLYDHCKQLIQIQPKTSLTIRLWQIPDILGSISFIIVDDERVFFLMPTLNQGVSSELIASRLGMGISFSDPNKLLVKELLELFEELRTHSNLVKYCKGNTEQ